MLVITLSYHREHLVKVDGFMFSLLSFKCFLASDKFLLDLLLFSFLSSELGLCTLQLLRLALLLFMLRIKFALDFRLGTLPEE